MAEETMENEERVKLFVGQVPKHMTEIQLLTLFREFSIVNEVNIIKEKTTRAPRGCCFLTCPTREDADKVINSFHNKKTLPGASSPLQVKYADGELERLEHKLFVGMLPKNVSETEVQSLFSEYGTIKDLQILRGSLQTSKGCLFLKYESKEQAVAAMEALNGRHIMEGANVPLIVKWADTEKERQARRLLKVQSHVSRLDPQNPSMFGALPMSYVPPYNGYGYHVPGTYGYMLPPIQTQHAFHNVISPNQGNGRALQGTALTESVPPRLAPRRNFPTALGNYGYHGLQYPMAFPRGMIPPRLPLTTVSPGISNNGTSIPSSLQTEGPAGANLFIYNIPREFEDQELAATFQPFGKVLSAKVFVDKATGISKCFGFISYDSQAAAQNAINTMNGCQLSGKKLKVQLKRDNGQQQQQQQSKNPLFNGLLNS
ncbi:RNA-binding protein BRN2 [Arabidopsis thaliana]|uniref:RNA-binding protein BRN2 n=1 Tax=Arabidopsis thaliana TaxID=3702 RepID=BRN2L_ARATH|nr:RNA-binding (RRM/RBD/RNP motifs) family protein [Arabidopsis thaliana]Q8GZ26.1 RecName: Full=RNA-binding protein BRN2; AltName: Full=Protein BRUNO-LIKE 2; Short=AtBRN2 [Arabidopsis thaliana]AAO63422.1 At1g03457 [Arabidopsis thaliana]AEE27573.1 RNA-binding (RRM/RBD/RNP motifs) family protein [Arabidopsis thaliana]BAC41921.1 putative ribonucleoprotein [Arabidopsis thaliana]|eukprot:NP_171845.2 RNA-binding (RRM/RBD/RNP motifs) family protein [Arabidopsis thaliana]